MTNFLCLLLLLGSTHAWLLAPSGRTLVITNYARTSLFGKSGDNDGPSIQDIGKDAAAAMSKSVDRYVRTKARSEATNISSIASPSLRSYWSLSDEYYR